MIITTDIVPCTYSSICITIRDRDTRIHNNIFITYNNDIHYYTIQISMRRRTCYIVIDNVWMDGGKRALDSCNIIKCTLWTPKKTFMIQKGTLSQ